MSTIHFRQAQNMQQQLQYLYHLLKFSPIDTLKETLTFMRITRDVPRPQVMETIAGLDISADEKRKAVKLVEQYDEDFKSNIRMYNAKVAVLDNFLTTGSIDAAIKEAHPYLENGGAGRRMRKAAA